MSLAATDILATPDAETPATAVVRPAAPLFQDRGGGRLAFIDGLRGVAAVSVMLMHFFHPEVSPIHEPLKRVFSPLVQRVLLQGDLGVMIFFVLSGFVISYTLRKEQVTPRYAANFMFRRSVRLDPPYWTMIAILVSWKCIFWHEYAGEIFAWFGGWRNVLANMFYAQDLLRSRGIAGYFGIVSVGWTLCLEVQFYLALITLLTLGTWARRRWGGRGEGFLLAAVLVPLTGYSLYVWFGVRTFEFFGMWYMFFAGAALWWTLAGRMQQRWLWLLVAAMIAGGCWRSDGRAIAAAVTVVAIYVAARSGGMYRWLDSRLWQYFGRISYSLYLSHMTVGVLVIGLIWEKGDKSVPLAAVTYVIAIAAAVAAADLLHRLVEAPFVRLAKRFKPAPSRAMAARRQDVAADAIAAAPAAEEPIALPLPVPAAAMVVQAS